MFQIPDLPFDPNLLNTGPAVGSLPWLVSLIISILIGPFVLMIGVRIMGSKASYGECFVTWLIALVVITLISMVTIFSVLISPLIALIMMIVLIFVLCCYFPKFVADRHNLSGWYTGLLALIIAAIFNAILDWIIASFFTFIPNIQLFTI